MVASRPMISPIVLERRRACTLLVSWLPTIGN
jgi:hypothetical protein